MRRANARSNSRDGVRSDRTANVPSPLQTEFQKVGFPHSGSGAAILAGFLHSRPAIPVILRPCAGLALSAAAAGRAC